MPSQCSAVSLGTQKHNRKVLIKLNPLTIPSLEGNDTYDKESYIKQSSKKRNLHKRIVLSNS